MGNYIASATLIPVASPDDATNYTFSANLRTLVEDYNQPGEFQIEGALLGNPNHHFECVFKSATTIEMPRSNPSGSGNFETVGTGTYFLDKTISMDIALIENRLGEPTGGLFKTGVKVADIRLKLTPESEKD